MDDVFRRTVGHPPATPDGTPSDDHVPASLAAARNFRSDRGGSDRRQGTDVCHLYDHGSSGGSPTVVNVAGGQKYYLEVNHKEGGGGDHVSVGWTTPSDSTTNVIAASFITPFDIDYAPDQKLVLTGGSTYDEDVGQGHRSKTISRT